MWIVLGNSFLPHFYIRTMRYISHIYIYTEWVNTTSPVHLSAVLGESHHGLYTVILVRLLIHAHMASQRVRRTRDHVTGNSRHANVVHLWTRRASPTTRVSSSRPDNVHSAHCWQTEQRRGGWRYNRIAHPPRQRNERRKRCQCVCVQCFTVHTHKESSISTTVLFICLLFYILATSKVISGRVPTCDSVHSWRLHSVSLTTPSTQEINTVKPL